MSKSKYIPYGEEFNYDMIWYNPKTNEILVTKECGPEFTISNGIIENDEEGCMCCYADQQGWILLDC